MDVLVKESGLENANAVQTPAAVCERIRTRNCELNCSGCKSVMTGGGACANRSESRETGRVFGE